MDKRFLKSRKNAMLKFKNIIEQSIKDYSIIKNKNELQEAYNIYMHFLNSNENTITCCSEIAHICKRCGFKILEHDIINSYEIGYYYN